MAIATDSAKEKPSDGSEEGNDLEVDLEQLESDGVFAGEDIDEDDVEENPASSEMD